LLIFIAVAVYFREPILGIEPGASADPRVVEQLEPSPAKEPLQSVVDMPAKKNLDQPLQSVEILPDIPESLPATDESAVSAPVEIIVPDNDYQFRPADEVAVSPAGEEDLLQKARKAYWNDELSRAKTLYLAYIDLYPENPDGYGELGNLLSTIGDLDAAAQMYQKAAELLVKQGQMEKAEQLYEVLTSIDVIQSEPMMSFSLRIYLAEIK